MLKKIQPILIMFGLFLASVLGGALAGYLLQPKEACAQCVAIPQLTGYYVNGNEDSYGAWVSGTVADTCDGATTIYNCPPNVSRTCVDYYYVGCAVRGCFPTIRHRNITCLALQVAGTVN